MALVDRYFSTTSAGAADGTTWADRAALIVTGAFNTIITGFNFAGSDSLRCRVGPGTYTLTAALSVSPTAANTLIFHGCDSSGNLLIVPDFAWRSNQLEWSTASLPVIATTTNISAINTANTTSRLLRFTASGRNSAMFANGLVDWCFVENSTANASAAAVSGIEKITNSVIIMTGSSYAFGLLVGSSQTAHNVRVVGVTGSSGNRDGIIVAGTTSLDSVIECTSIKHGGRGLASTSTNVNQRHQILRNTIAQNGGDGIQLASTASQVQTNLIEGNTVTGNGGYGINTQSAANALATRNRVDRNTSGNFNGFGNYPTDMDNYTTASTDAAEYVDAANGDFRIKNTAATWGMGFGPSDQPSSGGGSSGRRPQLRTINV